jgi:hypothetical protein
MSVQFVFAQCAQIRVLKNQKKTGLFANASLQQIKADFTT